jgi:diguanylate cyclase (GGDEF)-like protein/PAS domain S-box-containing protein
VLVGGLAAAGACLVAGIAVGTTIEVVALMLATIIVVQQVRHQGAARRAWGGLALALLLATVGAAIGWAAEGRLGQPMPLPHAADIAALASSLLLAVMLHTIAARRQRRTDPIRVLDSLIVGVAGAVVVGVFLVPEIIDHATGLGRAVILIALAIDVLLLIAVTTLAFTGVIWHSAGRLVLFSALSLICAGAIVRTDQVLLSDVDLAPYAIAFRVLAATMIVGAAIDPTSRRLVEPEHHPAHVLPPARLVLLVLAASVIPLTAFVRAASGQSVDYVVVGVGCALIVGLLLVRLVLVVSAARRQAGREAILRTVGARLGSSADLERVRLTILDTVEEMLGNDLRWCGVFTVNDRGALTLEELRSPNGPTDPLEIGLDRLLERMVAFPAEIDRVVDRVGWEVVLAPVHCQLAPRLLVVVAAHGTVRPELDESFGILTAQAALAADGVVQREELHKKRSEARFQQLVRHASDAIVILDAERRVRYQTPSVVRVLGFLPVDLDDTSIDLLAYPEQRDHFVRFLGQLLHGPPGMTRSIEVRLIRADDSLMDAEIVGANLLDNADVRGVVLTIRDVTKRRTLEDQLRHQAFHDALTGLPNRALFIDRVDHALERTRRTGGVSSAPAVLFVDLDDFKTVNDSMGHGAGDELLCVVAERLRRCLREGDTPARLGGDEFAILLEDVEDESVIDDVAERVLAGIHEPVRIERTELQVRASIGIATRADGDTTSAELLRNADLAMYTAKANGKGCIERFEPSMHHRALDRMAVTAELERAVEDGKIEVAYQPIVDIRDGAVLAFEALARWVHPVRGPVTPHEFVPIAEETGAILRLGHHVLETACRQLAAWRRDNEAASAWRMSVNLSARQLLADDLVDTVRLATEGAGIDPRDLTLELTETVLLSDSERVLERLQQLKDLGVSIAIDDFGTGYSSLSYLQRVPFDCIKIDRAFVAALQLEDPSSTLVRTIMDLAHTLDVDAIAEGIEQSIEVDGLVALGCRHGQGFFFGHPADAETISRRLGLQNVRS